MAELQSRVTLRAALLLCGAAASGVLPAAAPPVALGDLARAVASADPSTRLDFALVSIDEMALAYRAEAEHIAQRPRTAAEAASGARWSPGTAAYVQRLEALGDRTLTATTVDIHFDAGGDVLLVIDGETVVLSGPRIAEPGRLAGAIVSRFCGLQDCARLLPPADQTVDAVGARSPAPPRVEWSFSDRGGAVCRSDDGFEFLFSDTTDLVPKRTACALVIGEFRRIAARLVELQTQGVTVDLQRLAIAALSESGGHRLTLNIDGAYTRLALPALATTDGLLRAGLIWLDAQRRGAQATLRLSDAGVTLAPVIRLASGSQPAN